MSDRVFLIAEVGVNHDGSLDKAKALIDVAAAAGADAVKFQTFQADKLVSRDAPQAEYQKRNLGEPEGSQWELLKRLELSDEAHRSAAEHCAGLGIEFMSTPFDLDSARFLVEDLGVQRLKVSSGDLTNAPFLHALAGFGRPIILSSGMALLGDIELALGVLAHALTADTPPSRDAFRTAYASDEGQAKLREQISLLHCTTEYPAPPQAINLRAMDTLADAFGLDTGYSDHSLGISISLAAAARGARIIEKHITLDSKAHGPDHAASLEPDAFRQLVAGVREIEQALGSPRKRSLPSEEGNRAVATKSLVAARPIAAGEIFSADNLAVKRPATGLPPADYWELIGTPAPRDYDADAPITRA
jgi:N-acetylneuraminate synthase